MNKDWPENPRKRRDHLYIIVEILNVAREGILEPQIMYRVNLSFAQLDEYLSFLLKMDLLRVNTDNAEKPVYKTTAKGLEYLENFLTSLHNF